MSFMHYKHYKQNKYHNSNWELIILDDLFIVLHYNSFTFFEIFISSSLLVQITLQVFPSDNTLPFTIFSKCFY